MVLVMYVVCDGQRYRWPVAAADCRCGSLACSPSPVVSLWRGQSLVWSLVVTLTWSPLAFCHSWSSPTPPLTHCAWIRIVNTSWNTKINLCWVQLNMPHISTNWNSLASNLTNLNTFTPLKRANFLVEIFLKGYFEIFLFNPWRPNGVFFNLKSKSMS